jgi:rubrerythrin
MAGVAIDLGQDATLPESDAAGEFRCADCGYGVIVQRVLPPCPMCRGAVWERRDSRSAA